MAGKKKITMLCPVCQKEMKLLGEDTSYGQKDKAYTRQQFQCEKDDVWGIVEIPKTTS